MRKITTNLLNFTWRTHERASDVSVPGFGHSDIRGFGLLLAYRSMVRREPYFDRAFADPFPSVYYMDLLYGFAGGVVIKIIVYYRSKNAKKYRQGVEYGSARCGTEKDIQPYKDPVFENNIILTATEWLMMSGRSKNLKFARNKNILVIGGSGSGKTRFFVKPNLMQMHSSYVVTDPKG